MQIPLFILDKKVKMEIESSKIHIYLVERNWGKLVEEFDRVTEERGIESSIYLLRVALISEMVRDSSSIVPWFEERVKELKGRVESSLSLNIIKILVEIGCPPGIGYKLGEDDMLNMGNDQRRKLSNFLPPDIAGRIFVVENSEKEQEELGEGLKKFTNNLVQIMKIRVKFLSLEFINDYVEDIIEGVYSKLGIDLTDRLIDELGVAFFESGVGNSEPLSIPLQKIDIVSALGYASEVILDNEYPYLSEEGNRILNQVYNPFWNKSTYLEAGYPLNLI